ncbi:hypothetical protein [Desulfosporosinus sp. FKB]|uniref:hypothetical protein n=1 Tax=Desulfosporosinus sp. FKB TaxID=1969835 RepID=UPI000B4A4E89|nr:hypothetical protein [Desulfosporosinus sp. FKB]
MKGSAQEVFDWIYKNKDPYHTSESAGKWFAEVNTSYRGGDFAWGWGAIGVALYYMFKATGNLKYLDWMVPQIDWVISHRDTDLDVESYLGTRLKLPVWNDGGQYGSIHAYPVHTAVICIPILLFISVVRTLGIRRYFNRLDHYLLVCKDALEAHDTPGNWMDFSLMTGYPVEPNFGNFKEAGKVTMPNRGNAYLAACALLDKLCATSKHLAKAIKGFNYFYTCFRLDETSNSYYWSYWPYYYGESGWEDISHASLTMMGFWLAHLEACLSVYSTIDFQRVANTAKRIVHVDRGQIMVNDNISPSSTRKEFSSSGYRTSIGTWSLLAFYDPLVLTKINPCVSELINMIVNNRQRVIGDALKSIGICIYVNKSLGQGLDQYLSL